MAHFAQLDENNTVMQVIVVHNNELVESKQTTVNQDNTVSVAIVESEKKGIEFCKSVFGADTRWAQTSFNGEFRGKYAGVGDTYDVENNVFVASVVEDSFVAPVVEELVVETTAVEEPAPIVEFQPDTVTADIPALTTTDISSLG